MSKPKNPDQRLVVTGTEPTGQRQLPVVPAQDVLQPTPVGPIALEEELLALHERAARAELQRIDALHKEQLARIEAECQRRVEQCEADLAKRAAFEEKYNQLRIEHAALIERVATAERLKRSPAEMLLPMVCVSFGSAGMGAAPLFFPIASAHDVGLYFMIGSGLLLVLGLIASVYPLRPISQNSVA